jgi:RND family efflux transporter MFP subunit
LASIALGNQGEIQAEELSKFSSFWGREMNRALWAWSAPLLVFAGLACGGAEAEQDVAAREAGFASSKTGTRVDVVKLVPSNAVVEMSLLGAVEASRDANLGTTQGGYVESVHVRPGASVKQGAILAKVDSALHRILLEQATAQANLADAEYKRAVGLGDLIAASQLQAAETQMEVAKAGVKQAELNLDRAVVRAPFSGQVGAVHVERGEVVGPGMPVIRLVALKKAIVRLNVADRDVVALETGMKATIRLQAVSQTFVGKVTSIAPVADSDTRSFQVEVSVNNPDRKLLPGMIARVELVRELPADSVLIPQDWIVTGLDDQGVFIIEGTQARWRQVVLGDVVRDQVVVSSGLELGDRVVVAGHRSLVDGDTVLISREGTCCKSGRASF